MNTLIHADYQGHGGIVIEKYPDRFEFSNPGTLLISFDQLLHGNVSECRNKSLQRMFTMIGAAEKAGSGVDKIWMGWNSQHWRSPIVREQMKPERVLWILPMISLIPEETLSRLKRRFGAKFTKFNPLEVQALVTADIEGYVDNARMRQITNTHAADITKLFQNLVSQGVLTQDGQGRWTQYHLLPSTDSVHKEEIPDDRWDTLIKIVENARTNKRLPPKELELVILQLCQNEWLTRKQISDLLQRNPDGLRSRFLTPMVAHGLLQLRYSDKPNRSDQAYKASLQSQTEEKANHSVHKEGHSVHKTANHSVHKEGHSVHKTANHSVHKEGHSVHKEEIPDDRWDTLIKIVKNARINKRLPPKELELVILQLCQNEWLTRKQISDLLQRNPDSLRSRFLTPMVAHGLLQLRYSDKPNRSDQAYKAV